MAKIRVEISEKRPENQWKSETIIFFLINKKDKHLTKKKWEDLKSGHCYI